MSMLDVVSELEMKRPLAGEKKADVEDDELLGLFKMVHANRKFGLNTSAMVQVFRNKFFELPMNDRLRLAASADPLVEEVVKVFGINNIEITSML